MRPQKTTVDYFPHNTTGGKTIFILENLYGNDGYAAWFKILELLGSTSGHYYDFNSQSNFQYLCAKIGVSGEKTTAILNTLSELEAIDPELHQKGIIWSENFVKNLEVVYQKRKTQKPEKPGYLHGNDSSLSENSQTDDILTPKTRQSKVKYSKVNKRKDYSPEPKDSAHVPEEIAPLVPTQVPVLLFPLITKGEEYPIYQSDIDQWQDSFPGINVILELKGCRQWNLDNPSNRKTKTGIRRHICTWLSRSQNRAPKVSLPLQAKASAGGVNCEKCEYKTTPNCLSKTDETRSNCTYFTIGGLS